MIDAAWNLIALFFKIVGAICFFLSAIFAGVALFGFIKDVLGLIGEEVCERLDEWLEKKDQ